MSNPIEKYAAPIIFIAIFLASIGFVYRIWNTFSPTSESLALLNVITLIITGIVIIVYTYVTNGLWKESQRQIEVQQRPFVIFECFRSDKNNERFIPTLKNIGNGVAINVRIKEEIIVKSLNIDTNRYMDTYSFSYTDGDHIIQRNDEFSIYDGHWEILSISEVPLPHNRFQLLFPQESHTWYKTIIEFQNIDMIKYYVEQEKNPEGLFIRKSGRL